MHTKKSDMMKVERLRKRSDFVLLNKKAKKWVSNGLVIQAWERPTDSIIPADQIRLGFTVTKKVDKSAVRRNRIKRRLRAAAADAMAQHAKVGYDYNIIGRPLTATRPYEQLVKDIKWCLKKMELYQ